MPVPEDVQTPPVAPPPTVPPKPAVALPAQIVWLPPALAVAGALTVSTAGGAEVAVTQPATDDDLVLIAVVGQRGRQVRVAGIGRGGADVGEGCAAILAHLPLIGQAVTRGCHGEDSR